MSLPPLGPPGRPEPHWQAFEGGLGRQVRVNWRRHVQEPSPEALLALQERSDRLRLQDVQRVDPRFEKDRRYVLGVLQILLGVMLFGQRIALPLGGSPIALSLIATFVAIGFLALRRGVVTNRARTELYLAALIVMVVATWTTNLAGNYISLTSISLLLILYLPFVVCVAPQFRVNFVPLCRTYVRFMIGFSILGGLQMVAQLLLGWKYEDYLADVVGLDFLQANFNTENQISYTNHTVKANAFFFLEPSFLCQFCALGILIALIIKAPAWQPMVLGLGMASTLSGTGILLLVFGATLIMLRIPNRIRPGVLLAGGLCLVIIFLTPAAGILLDRRDETSQAGSSGSLRFVQPYTEVLKGMQEDPNYYLNGAGAGAADRLLVSDRFGGEAVVYTIAPKVLFEYGLIALVAFMSFLFVAVLRGPPVPVLAGAILFMINFLSGSLLAPHTVLIAWILTSIWGAPVTFGLTDSLAARRRATSREAREQQLVRS
ncbi:hypothetical protein ACIB24_05190 [Spongisporangium articulatum]|uniref:O-antigen ligase like membrane protein n=1 Tax=Spongisporangium articulatum TaxID=3362603 RepID=A0ABW8AJ95_9ACTN